MTEDSKLAPRKRERWTLHWNHLFEEIVATDICTGCSGCIVSCPYDVLGYDDHWHPFLLDEARVDGSPARCVHGEKRCTMCTRACPRFRAWEPEIDEHLWGRPRNPDDPDEVVGVYQDLLLVRSTNPEWLEKGQDGGLCSAMLIYSLRKGYIDAALVNYVDEDWNATPGVAATEEDILRAAGSRYTYSANLLAHPDALESGAENLALVGMGCMSSVPPVMLKRGARKAGRRIALNIGLLCSKAFTDDLFDGLLEPSYGLRRTDIIKMNIKGKLQLWLRPGVNDENFIEVPLKECFPFTRPGCETCPDFAAEHADLSMGGLGQAGWTLTIVRTDLGRQILDEMTTDGWVEVRDAVDTDPRTVDLARKLAVRSRKRWPITTVEGQDDGAAVPGRLPLPKPQPL